MQPDSSSYAITKTTCEQFIAFSGVDFISFRLCNAFGPRNFTGPIPSFFKRLSKGEVCTVVNTRRDYIYITDLVSLVMRAINGEGKKGYYHIATGSDNSIGDVYRMVRDIMGIYREPLLKDRGEDDTYTILLDPSKTHQDFPGWSAKTPLSVGIMNTIAWYKEHGIGETYTHLRATK
jgi:UDP-glucose 4-epimerase